MFLSLYCGIVQLFRLFMSHLSLLFRPWQHQLDLHKAHAHSWEQKATHPWRLQNMDDQCWTEKLWHIYTNMVETTNMVEQCWTMLNKNLLRYVFHAKFQKGWKNMACDPAATGREPLEDWQGFCQLLSLVSHFDYLRFACWTIKTMKTMN